jgi:hypothetical protein
VKKPAKSSRPVISDSESEKSQKRLKSKNVKSIEAILNKESTLLSSAKKMTPKEILDDIALEKKNLFGLSSKAEPIVSEEEESVRSQQQEEEPTKELLNVKADPENEEVFSHKSSE